MHIGVNHPFIVGYGANILCHSQYEQMNCLKKITDWTLEDTNNDKLTKIRYMYNVIKFRTI